MVDDEEDNSDDQIKQIDERKKVRKNKLLRSQIKPNIFTAERTTEKNK